MATFMSASTSSMTARLISKLSLNHQDEPVDLGNLRCLKNGFVAPRFYLVGKLNTVRAVNCGNSQFTFEDLPAAPTTSATGQLIGETIGQVLKVDEHRIINGLVRVRLTLPLHDPVRLERRIRVSPEDVIMVKFRYERLLGRCKDYAMINHGGLPCPSLQEPPSPVVSPAIQPAAPPMMVFRDNTHVSFSVPQVADLATPKEKRSVSIREVPDFPSPSKITGVRRGREEEDDDGGKRARHSLMMVPI
ncbi:hypothetical protein ACLB2K_028668 [Fragaria x ananassa]